MVLSAQPFTYTVLRAVAAELDRGIARAAEATDDEDARDALETAQERVNAAVSAIGQAEDDIRQAERPQLHIAREGAALRVRS